MKDKTKRKIRIYVELERVWIISKEQGKVRQARRVEKKLEEIDADVFNSRLRGKK